MAETLTNRKESKIPAVWAAEFYKNSKELVSPEDSQATKDLAESIVLTVPPRILFLAKQPSKELLIDMQNRIKTLLDTVPRRTFERQYLASAEECFSYREKISLLRKISRIYLDICFGSQKMEKSIDLTLSLKSKSYTLPELANLVAESTIIGLDMFDMEDLMDKANQKNLKRQNISKRQAVTA